MKLAEYFYLELSVSEANATFIGPFANYPSAQAHQFDYAPTAVIRQQFAPVRTDLVLAPEIHISSL